MSIKRLWLPLLAGCLSLSANAQELNARITVNGDKVQSTDKQVFATLQNALTEFVNSRKWTDATFNTNERIDCTMSIIVNEQDNSSFKAEIQVQARRPVYNSSYTTPILNFRDQQLNFEYTEFQPLEYVDNRLENNLTATVIFYIYVILGLDFDSFSPLGGNIFFQQAQQIVSLAQSQMSWTGWKAFDNTQNRHAVATALTDNTSEAFRQMWYTYHRKGLDEMAANADRGRTTLLTALPVLQQIKSTRPTSVILQMFSDAKLDELVAVYSKATSQEKQEGLKTLSSLYPAQSARLEPLKK
ncbi:hypothetical protein Barb6_02296 [Bacteroidales bacterium Barb6]|nr:hypothetical protein Barb6_02296 [Bacteroidales bacterium Barb6]OAV68522.1 hypothetical protein Barb4_02052 [Bacteroidales bacterium Barb4]